MPSKYVDVQGVATFLRHAGPTTLPERPPELGRGEVVLCLHHRGGNARNFDAFASQLAEHHSPVAFDLPGHDRSGSQVGLVSIDAMADFAASVLKGIEADRPAVVVGHGMGGKVALQLARSHGEAVKALVLVGSGAGYTNGDDLIERARLVSLGRARREFDPRAFGKNTPRPVLRSGFMDTMKTDPRIVYSNLIAMRDWDGEAALGQVDVPVLFVMGEAESDDVREDVERTATKLANARIEVLDDAAHMLPLEHPGALADCVTAFLGDLS